MLVSDNNKNRGAHGDSSFMLVGMPTSSENLQDLSVWSAKNLECYVHGELTTYDMRKTLYAEKNWRVELK